MDRSRSLTRHTGATASTTPPRWPAPGAALPRSPLPRLAPGSTLVAIPALERSTREAYLTQLAGNVAACEPLNWYVTSLAVQVLASTRLDRDAAVACWDDYMAAQARLDSILAGEPDYDGVLSCVDASFAAHACMDALLDGTPAP